jgi:hypothetical protein
VSTTAQNIDDCGVLTLWFYALAMVAKSISIIFIGALPSESKVGA